MYKDPICAIATPYGVAAISVIRTSGSGCIDLVNKVFKGSNLTKALPNTIHYGYIVDNDETIDEVLVSVFKGPKSFTAEDSCEISCHGGIYNTNRVLETLLNCGFRLANPGEFSQRAFLNGRIDLTQSEAIMDIIEADNKLALKSAINSLRSSTKNLILDLRSDIIDIIASIEVNIDYPEYDDAVVMTNEIILPKLTKVIDKIKIVLEKSNISKIAIHGINTAIIGRPNVGKSSLLNILLEEEKAIVTDIAGTTRDTIEGRLSLGNVTLNLIDTAGIRESLDVVESIGIKKSFSMLEKSELIILVLDNSLPLTLEDEKLLDITSHKKRIIVGNKSDIDSKINIPNVINISAKNKEGINLLEERLLEITKINEFNVDDQNYLSNTRHISNMKKALDSLNDAYNACLANVDVDMIEIDIKAAWLTLGEIIGQTSSDLLLDELFSKFCLGK